MDYIHEDQHDKIGWIDTSTMLADVWYVESIQDDESQEVAQTFGLVRTANFQK